MTYQTCRWTWTIAEIDGQMVYTQTKGRLSSALYSYCQVQKTHVKNIWSHFFMHNIYNHKLNKCQWNKRDGFLTLTILIHTNLSRCHTDNKQRSLTSLFTVLIALTLQRIFRRYSELWYLTRRSYLLRI